MEKPAIYNEFLQILPTSKLFQTQKSLASQTGHSHRFITSSANSAETTNQAHLTCFEFVNIAWTQLGKLTHLEINPPQKEKLQTTDSKF